MTEDNIDTFSQLFIMQCLYHVHWVSVPQSWMHCTEAPILPLSFVDAEVLICTIVMLHPRRSNLVEKVMMLCVKNMWVVLTFVDFPISLVTPSRSIGYQRLLSAIHGVGLVSPDVATFCIQPLLFEEEDKRQRRVEKTIRLGGEEVADSTSPLTKGKKEERHIWYRLSKAFSKYIKREEFHLFYCSIITRIVWLFGLCTIFLEESCLVVS